MAKYTLTEELKRTIKEVAVIPGKFDYNPLLYFFKYVINSTIVTNPKLLVKFTRMFFQQEMGKKLKDIDDDRLLMYLVDLGGSDYAHHSKILRKSSTIASLSYFLFKNIFKPKEYQGLEFIKRVDSPYHRYFFFDPEIQEFVGMIELQKSLRLPGNSMKINVSAVEKEYVGRGYGSRMYLCVINQYDYLGSDETLYPDSLNMWVNYLPEKVNVWAKVNNQYFKLSSKNFIDPENVIIYIASSNKSIPPRK